MAVLVVVLIMCFGSRVGVRFADEFERMCRVEGCILYLQLRVLFEGCSEFCEVQTVFPLKFSVALYLSIDTNGQIISMRDLQPELI
jgi:hypothetical protein